jgi:hypothetical protein
MERGVNTMARALGGKSVAARAQVAVPEAS